MQAMTTPRPEHVHYDLIEEHLQRSIQEGSDFLFDTAKFEAELRRLWEEYNVPYQVRSIVPACQRVL